MPLYNHNTTILIVNKMPMNNAQNSKKSSEGQFWHPS
jgi:hypothetical protein